VKFEIERKFLVLRNDWQDLTTRRIAIRQAYLTSEGKASIRARIKGDGAATLSVKSRGAECRRLELEYSIPTLEAEAMMALRQGAVIEKIRHLVPWGDLTWEIDVFSGDNTGLTIAEIELPSEHHPFTLPPWIGAEITGQAQYYNGALARRPFCEWPRIRDRAAGSVS
jgi:adenylate cyclase